MTAPTQEPTVRKRMDGRGDAWALAHREGLGPCFNMNDLDTVIGFMAYGINSSETLFAEYVPDAYANKGKMVRRFAVVALFDRKRSERAITASDVSTSFYLYLSRALGTQQPKPPRFFYVIGGDLPPWSMREVDINTGNLASSIVTIKSLENQEWLAVWDRLGLLNLRRELRAFVDPRTR